MTNEPGIASEPSVIVQLPRDGAVDRELHAYPPPSVASGRVVLDHVLAGADGRLGPPEAGEIVMSVLSPEALRQPSEVRDAIELAPEKHRPLMIIVEAAEELREEELTVVVDAAERAHRQVIVRIMADA
jgi:hypothetical protein